MIRQFLIILLVSLACSTHAAPGAHGPNGEHLDAPASTGSAANAQPTIEASTEAFELVGTLAADELSVMVDRYVTNEPVLNGTLEVEFNGTRAQGKLHADYGDYSFTDEKLLKALRQPGNHALVFTLITGNESDLIEGTLNVAPHGHADGLGALWQARWPWIVLLATLILVAAAWGVRRCYLQKKNGGQTC
ncbi:hypothetical protein Tamer19_58730 [Cupriavidus sp. TA19]|uniref:hypothetical protein n=1 Tax=unclassified Cupriavidus TaxID=2640874 RepID=UPI000E2F1186|nr:MULTISPECIES: hypothetical protein [unclassified Cupriavidus]BDB28819.1 hypothetical protein CTP10_R62310 [Cupriavidus sp. P-10]GLC96464.1 hypothetical protein Tamer19_58730 [Cupriavidus sp. TA19]